MNRPLFLSLALLPFLLAASAQTPAAAPSARRTNAGDPPPSGFTKVVTLWPGEAPRPWNPYSLKASKSPWRHSTVAPEA